MNDLRRNWFRRRPVHAVALMAGLIVLLTYGAAGGMESVFGISAKNLPLWRLPDVLLPIIAPAFAAGAFAKEREQRTWQDILLTRLSAGEILTGKFYAAFLPTIASIVILLPPFALILILMNVSWAQQPGVWMVGFGTKFLINAVFYLSVALVCSYHNSTTRNSLVVGYVLLGLYTGLTFSLWSAFETTFADPVNTYITPYSSSTSQSNSLLTLSRTEFGFSASEIGYVLQSILLSGLLLSYLKFRIGQRRAD